MIASPRLAFSAMVLVAVLSFATGCEGKQSEAASEPREQAEAAAPADSERTLDDYRPRTFMADDPPESGVEESEVQPSMDAVSSEILSPLVDARKEDLDQMVERRQVRLLVNYGATSFFIDRGSLAGSSHALGRLLEQELNQRFQPGARQIHVIYVPVTRDQLIPALLAGYGDVAAANLTITPARAAQVAFSNPFFSRVEEIVVTAPDTPPVTKPEDLSGREVYVRGSSSYAESLAELNERLLEQGLPAAIVKPVDERLEDEDIIEMVATGLYPATVVDDYVARLWAEIFTGLNLNPDASLRSGGQIAWAMRPDDVQLKAFVDDFVQRHRVGTKLGNIIRNRYFRNATRLKNPVRGRDLERFQSLQNLFGEYAEQYDFNYLLLMALAYRESGLDQSARSRAGAVGIMQIKPATAADRRVGIKNIDQLENNVHAGTRYLRVLLDQLQLAELDPIERHLFAFASYNAGPNRIARLRRQASEMGFDPNRWFGNVEVMAAMDIGRETPQYVSRIFKYYLAYQLVAERARERAEATELRSEL